jgi:hypothetical protein
MKPLVCEALGSTRPSKTEKLLMWVPVLGWELAATLERARFAPMTRSIERQLRERPNTSDLWGADTRRQQVSSTVRTIAKEELGWPNDHFIPGDPCAIVFWGHKDGLDAVSAVMRLEKELDVDLSDAESECLMRQGTLGELVDRLLANERNA